MWLKCYGGALHGEQVQVPDRAGNDPPAPRYVIREPLPPVSLKLNADVADQIVPTHEYDTVPIHFSRHGGFYRWVLVPAGLNEAEQKSLLHRFGVIHDPR